MSTINFFHHDSCLSFKYLFFYSDDHVENPTKSRRSILRKFKSVVDSERSILNSLRYNYKLISHQSKIFICFYFYFYFSDKLNEAFSLTVDNPNDDSSSSALPTDAIGSSQPQQKPVDTNQLQLNLHSSSLQNGNSTSQCSIGKNFNQK